MQMPVTCRIDAGLAWLWSWLSYVQCASSSRSREHGGKPACAAAGQGGWAGLRRYPWLPATVELSCPVPAVGEQLAVSGSLSAGDEPERRVEVPEAGRQTPAAKRKVRNPCGLAPQPNCPEDAFVHFSGRRDQRPGRTASGAVVRW